MSNLYRGPAIDAAYQDSIRFVNQSGQNEQSLDRTFHRCFLPSFTSFGWGVSEEKIKMWKVNGWQTTDDGCQVMAKAHIAFGKVS
jgi:hypothetical protein